MRAELLLDRFAGDRCRLRPAASASFAELSQLFHHPGWNHRMRKRSAAAGSAASCIDELANRPSLTQQPAQFVGTMAG